MTPDRRTVTEAGEMKPGYDGTRVDIRQDDPIEVDGERTIPERNYTRDQIAILRRSGTLSMQEAEAGRRLQLLRERAAIGGLRAQEYERTFQDRNVVMGRDSHIPEQVQWAFYRLRTIRSHMTVMNWEIVKSVALENLSGPEMVKRFPRYRLHSIWPRTGEAFEELCNVFDRR